MSNFSSLLKDEIIRLARREIKTELAALRKAIVQYRADIAALKRRTKDLEQRVSRLQRGTPRAPSIDASQEKQLRWSATGFAKLRQRLGLSAEDMGLLLGASAISIYKWENDNQGVRPRAKFMPAIAAVRKITKRQAAELLSALK